jgi:hypothetical protein
VRRWLGRASLALLLGVAGCGGTRAQADGGHADPAPSRWPAAIAGGACQLLDYDVIAAAIGVQFDVAAAGTSAATFTCVVQRTAADLPDLSLAVTATQADPTTFKTSVQPKSSATVTDLGKVGYSVPVAATKDAGPGLEVGWLSGNQRLIVLRYRSPSGTAAGDLTALLPKLVDLARKIDQTSV